MPSLEWKVSVGDLPEPEAAPYVQFLDQDDTGAPPTSEGVALVGQVAAFPFQFNGSGELLLVSDQEAIQAEVKQVLGTEAASGVTSGELEWSPEKGSLINRLRHMNESPASLALARELVGRSLEQFVTSIFVRNVDITIEDSEGGRVMRLRVLYAVRAQGTEGLVEVVV